MKTHSIDLVRKTSEALRPSLRKRPESGWVVAIREATGMSAAELARRCKVTRSRIAYAETAELRGRITIRSMQKIAQAIDCEFVYAILPKSNLHDLLVSEARRAIIDFRRRSEPGEMLNASAQRVLQLECILQLFPVFWRNSGRKRTRKKRRAMGSYLSKRDVTKLLKLGLASGSFVMPKLRKRRAG